MPEPLPNPSDAELARYLSGAANRAEAQEIERWLAAAPEHQVRLEDLRLVLLGTEPPQMQWDPDASWRILAERLEPARGPEVVAPARPSGTQRFSVAERASGWLGRALIAAGLAAMVAGGWYIERRAAQLGSHAVSAPLVAERRTGRGERVLFRLPDGTGVMLGPLSTLAYSADYGHGERAVRLEGDGYFDVVHDASRPFVVRTATAQVRDIGTRFALRERTGERGLDVVVADGSVAVRHPSARDSLLLARGDVARLPATGPAVVRRGVDTRRYLGWTEGELDFERTPLPIVIAELQRWYDVEITLASRDLERRLLTASFRDKPIPEVLTLIAASLDIAVSRAGQRYVLSNR